METQHARTRAQLEFVLSNIEPGRSAEYLSKYLESNQIAKDGSGPWIELIGKAGGPAELTGLLSQASEGGLDDPATVRALQALASAQRLQKKRPAGNVGSVAKLFNADNEAVRLAAIRLAGNWKLDGQVKPLATKAEQGSSSNIRGAAIEALREIGKPAVSYTHLTLPTNREV